MAKPNAPGASQIEPLAVPSPHSGEDPVSFAGKVLERVAKAAKKLQPSDAEEILRMTAGPVIDADKLEALSNRLSDFGLEELSELAVNAAALIDLQDPRLKQIWGGAFNGQMGRRSIMSELVVGLGVTAILETGTFRGSTTEYMAERFNLPVYSCEVNRRYYHYSRLRLADKPNVKLTLSDSRIFLKTLLESGDLPDGQLLCYLDAHWADDLPIWEEIDLIFALNPSAIAVVDDFRVPGDRGFHYDDYGRGKCLSAIDLRANVAAEIDMLFPKRSAAAETGARRGMVALAKSETADRILNLVPDLERLEWRQAVSTDAVVGELPAVTIAVSDVRNVVERQGEMTRGALGTIGDALQGKFADVLAAVERQGEAMRLGIAALRNPVKSAGDSAVAVTAEDPDASERRSEQLIEIISRLRAEAASNQVMIRQQAIAISEYNTIIDAKHREVKESQQLLSSLGRELVTLENERTARSEQIHTLTARLEESEADRAARLEQILALTARLEASEADGAARLEQIHTLTGWLKQSETERAEQSTQIQALTARLEASETDRAAGSRQFHALMADMEQSKADRAKRLTQIHTLTAQLEASAADGAARSEQINALMARLEESEADRADRLTQIERLQEKLRRRRTLWQKIRGRLR